MESVPFDKPSSTWAGSRTEEHLGSQEGPQCLVVMYHYVRPQDPSLQEGIRGLTPSEFNAQLEYLCRELESIDWPDLDAWMQGEGSIPDRSFLLTFDDGLADHARTVLPILQEWNLRGVFFVPGIILTSQQMLPAHAIHLLLAVLGESAFEQELLNELARRDDRMDPYAFVDAAQAERMYDYESPSRARLKYLLTVALPIPIRNEIVRTMFERHVGSSAEWSKRWYLGWDDLVTMQSLGHTIGGHGFRHEPYLRLTPPQRRADLRRIADVLREGLGPDIRPFSYPYGSVDESTAHSCRDTGFAAAFTTEPRRVNRRSDRMRLPRVDTIHVEAVLAGRAKCLQA